MFEAANSENLYKHPRKEKNSVMLWLSMMNFRVYGPMEEGCIGKLTAQTKICPAYRAPSETRFAEDKTCK